MREDGQPVDNFLIIPGVEVTTAEGHLLCIGATLPYLKGKPAREVCEIIHERGGLAIPPHPYDLFRAGIRFPVLETLPIDALEVFNAATTLRRYNRYAFKYAQLRGLPMTASSDAHHSEAVGTAYTILNTSDFSVQGVIAQIVQEQRTEPALSDSARQHAENLEQLAAPAPPEKTADDDGKIRQRRQDLKHVERRLSEASDAFGLRALAKKFEMFRRNVPT